VSAARTAYCHVQNMLTCSILSCAGSVPVLTKPLEDIDFGGQTRNPHFRHSERRVSAACAAYCHVRVVLYYAMRYVLWWGNRTNWMPVVRHFGYAHTWLAVEKVLLLDVLVVSRLMNMVSFLPSRGGCYSAAAAFTAIARPLQCGVQVIQAKDPSAIAHRIHPIYLCIWCRALVARCGCCRSPLVPLLSGFCRHMAELRTHLL
jgi:hypothetical protein